MENKKIISTEKSKCPVCGKYRFKFWHDLCPFCGWEHDEVQDDDHTFIGGANIKSLDQYKKAYLKKIKANPKYVWTIKSTSK